MTSSDDNDFRSPLRARSPVSLPPWAGGTAASVTVVIAVEPSANACGSRTWVLVAALPLGEDQN